MKKTKKLLEETILLAVNSISEDIRSTTNIDDNTHRAEAIKLLAEAYNIVRRGGKQ